MMGHNEKQSRGFLVVVAEDFLWDITCAIENIVIENVHSRTAKHTSSLKQCNPCIIVALIFRFSFVVVLNHLFRHYLPLHKATSMNEAK